jgi:hypothetical protein
MLVWLMALKSMSLSRFVNSCKILLKNISVFAGEAGFAGAKFNN